VFTYIVYFCSRIDLSVLILQDISTGEKPQSPRATHRNVH